MYFHPHAVTMLCTLQSNALNSLQYYIWQACTFANLLGIQIVVYKYLGVQKETPMNAVYVCSSDKKGVFSTLNFTQFL